ncbi:MAG: type I-C CRISPR-associated protein Cas8c/Csd1 [Verrucomicrobia bacterium]|nr:type I-C CRISPR-associated protein Cas8c/Csd1 [Verrucomicrobiota bacterium]
MIKELLQLARLRGLTGCEPTRQRPIHWLIELDESGQVLGFTQTSRETSTKDNTRREERGKVFTVPANYHMQWKTGKVQSVCTNDSNWLPDFLCAPPHEIFPKGVNGDLVYGFRQVRAQIRRDGKKHADRQRIFKLRKWRRLIFEAARGCPGSVVLQGMAKFLRSAQRKDFSCLPLAVHGEERQKLLEAFSKGQETFSFRVCGKLAVNDTAALKWWQAKVAAQREEVTQRSATGTDLFQEGTGRLTDYFPSIHRNVALASFNAAPFASYGLGSQTTTMRIDTAEQAAAAFAWLLQDRSHSLKLGDELAVVFWAVAEAAGRTIESPFVGLLEIQDSLAVREFFSGVWGSRLPAFDSAPFHAAILTLPSQGRFALQSWHTAKLEDAERHLRRFFEHSFLDEDVEKAPALHDLAWATIAKAKGQKAKPAAATYSSLFNTALFGQPLPSHFLPAVLERQRIEMGGIDPKKERAFFQKRLLARTALIKLYLTHNLGIFMNKQTALQANDAAMLCGRLLAILDKIHDEAHDRKSASSPANRLYGAASATPALVFPQLCKLARHHLAKLDRWDRERFEWGVKAGERKDDVPEDFEGLCHVFARLGDAGGGSFPRMLSLEEQGRFAIGFYYQRALCQNWPTKKARKPTATADATAS